MSSTATTGQVVQSDVPVLLPLLHGVVAQWEQFGCHLPVSYSRIQEIRKGQNQSKGVRDKLAEVLNWYRLQPGPKDWSHIVKALKEIRNFDLASRIPQSGQVPVNETGYINTMVERYCLKEVTAEWKSFGMQLGVPYLELKSMDQGRLTPRDCMEELLHVWIQCQGKEANIAAVIRACRGVRDYTLAEQLEGNASIRRIMARTENDLRMQHQTAVANVAIPDEKRIIDQQRTEQGVDERAKSILRRYQIKLNESIVAAGLTTIVYLCEERELITPSMKSILVSQTTGQTEEVRVYQLLDAIRNSLAFDAWEVMDKFLCIMFEFGGLNGQFLAKHMAEDFGYPLENFNKLAGTAQGKKAEELPTINHTQEHSPSTDNLLIDPKHATTGANSSTVELPDQKLDSKLLLNKSPLIEDILEVVPVEMDCRKFREFLKIPVSGDLQTALDVWIREEPSDVTWKNLIKGLKESSGTTTVARFIINTYLRRPSVYKRYINCIDFESFEDLGID